jgi:hypothetical protein
MKLQTCPAILLLILSASMFLAGCRRNDRQDTVTGSAANPSHTYRATIILRQYYVDGKFDNSPTTYVLVDKDSGSPNYKNGAEFTASQVVMKPSQCGPLNVQWTDDHALKVICEKCGLALSAVGKYASRMDGIRIEYEGFPEMSSWEAAPRIN